MKIALVGNQNSGKTTLFNYLTGMNSKVGNWPGVTIEKKTGIIKGTTHELIDLPGIYSLSPYSIEEEVSRKYIFEEKPDVIINIIDSTTIERSLYLTTQLLELDCKIIIALNMVNFLEKKGFLIDEHKLEQLLGIKVFKISALNGTGVDDILQELNKNEIVNKNNLYLYDAKIEQAIFDIQYNIKNNANKRFVAVKLLEDDKRFEDLSSVKIRKIVENISLYSNIDLEEEIATERYEFIRQVKEQVIKKIENQNINISDKIDKVLLNKWLAFPIFAVIMFFIYYLSVGVIGKYTVDLIGEKVQVFSNWTSSLLEKIGIAKSLNSLVVDGIIKGVGSVLSFVPQLMILFGCISILETTGYMSRIALLLDKLFRQIGLSREKFDTIYNRIRM